VCVCVCVCMHVRARVLARAHEEIDLASVAAGVTRLVSGSYS